MQQGLCCKKLFFLSCSKWGLSLEARTADEKAEEKKGFDLNGFNQYRSDRIPLDRSVPDNRHSRSVDYDSIPLWYYVAKADRVTGEY